MEGFVKIKDHPEYQISKEGVIIGKTGKALKFNINVDGYPVVYLRTGGVKVCARVHRLIAIQFIDNPEGKPFVNHLDGNKLNFSLDNLEWCTQKENVDHAREVLGFSHLPNVSTTEVQVLEICNLLEQGVSPIKVAQTVCVSEDVVCKIKTGVSWSHISCNFNFNKRVGKVLIQDVIDVVHLVNQGLNAREITRTLNRTGVTYDMVKRIAQGKSYSEITKDILLPKEKRSQTSRKA